ncbi:MAG: oligosaccharide flippase family protein [Patescibacteria group bacterium]
MNKMERLFGFNVSYLARGSFWLSLGQLATMSSAFFLSIAYARFLPKSVYGDYRYILSALSIVGIFALPGIGTSITRSVARGFDGTFRQGSKYIFFGSFGISLVGFGIASYFFITGDTTLAWGFIIASLVVPAVEGLGNWRAYFDGKKEFRAKTILNIIDQLFYFCSMAMAIGAIFYFRLSPASSLLVLLAAYSLGEGLPNIFFYLQTLRKIPKEVSIEPGSIHYGLQLSLVNIPATVANYLDAVLIHMFLGPAALATYSFAIALPEQIKSLLGTFADVTFPKIAAHPDTVGLQDTLLKKALRATAISALIVLLYIIAAPWIYQLLFPRYIESVLLSQVFALSLVIFPFTIFNTAMKATGDIKKIYIYNIISPLIQIVALALLIYPYGLWGAVAGRIIGRITNIMLPIFLFQKHR